VSVRFRRCALVGAALVSLSLSACASVRAGHGVSGPPVTSRPATTSSTAAKPTTSASRPPRRIPTHPVPPSTHPAPPSTRSAPPAARPGLPLGLSTGTATQVITVVAPSMGSTTATLQAWQKSGAQWVPHGPAIPAHVGSQGLTTHMSESVSATPTGSYPMSQAFGHNPNPGTSLPYTATTPADWWISQSGPLYNTRQRCASKCSFAQSAPNEHLYYETPYYNYAVVIDYNTVHPVQGAGSAIFLHVTDGTATAGCVAIPQANLVSILQWLTPAAHPRILIGAAG
jgi:L,D-peptidoglycan transpeptidase YkuD (ErfK/YbiS/YcfS/YnhG family)